MPGEQVVQHQPNALGCGGKPNQTHEHVLIVDRSPVQRVGQAEACNAQPCPLDQQEQACNGKKQGYGSEHSRSLNGQIIGATAVPPGAA